MCPINKFSNSDKLFAKFLRSHMSVNDKNEISFSSNR